MPPPPRAWAGGGRIRAQRVTPTRRSPATGRLKTHPDLGSRLRFVLCSVQFTSGCGSRDHVHDQPSDHVHDPRWGRPRPRTARLYTRYGHPTLSGWLPPSPRPRTRIDRTNMCVDMMCMYVHLVSDLVSHLPLGRIVYDGHVAAIKRCTMARSPPISPRGCVRVRVAAFACGSALSTHRARTPHLAARPRVPRSSILVVWHEG